MKNIFILLTDIFLFWSSLKRITVSLIYSKDLIFMRKDKNSKYVKEN